MNERRQRTDEPFVRILKMNEPLHLADDIPLRDVLPGVWPTIGDLRRLIKDYERMAANRAVSSRTAPGHR